MGYDIYDTETGNLWASFPNESAALIEVQRAVGETGAKSIASWAMGRSDHVGKAIFGKELVERARRWADAREAIITAHPEFANDDGLGIMDPPSSSLSGHARRPAATPRR